MGRKGTREGRTWSGCVGAFPPERCGVHIPGDRTLHVVQDVVPVMPMLRMSGGILGMRPPSEEDGEA